MGRPETILQFGGGRFLRGFVDLFVHEANLAGTYDGSIVIVQSSDSGRSDALKAQGGKYHVLIRGKENGIVVDEEIEVGSVSRALEAKRDWNEILMIATSPHLRFIVSNTTEKGYELMNEDSQGDPTFQKAPNSYPAKLLSLLKARFRAGEPGVTILPCELIEKNGEALLNQVLKQADNWNEPVEVRDWLRNDCFWSSTLVDRIVTERPEGHRLSQTDELLTVAEPFALWAIEMREGMSPPFPHPAIKMTLDVTSYHLRKVRILNGAHTALISRAIPMGFKTVREAIADPTLSSWLRQVLFDEIVPTIRDRVDSADEFAEKTLERFANPYLNHKLTDIALYDDTKRQIRLVPTQNEFLEKFGHRPPLLDEILGIKE